MEKIEFRKRYMTDDAGECFGKRFASTPIGILRNLWFKLKLSRAIKGHASKGRVLDCPSGNGRFTETIRRFSPSCHVGVDVSFEMLRWAKKRGLKHAVQCDAFCLPFKDDTFDLAISVRFLHHLEGATRTAAVREIVRVSKTSLLFYDSIHVFRQWMRWIKNIIGVSEKRLRGVSVVEVRQDVDGTGKSLDDIWWVLFPVSAQMAALVVSSGSIKMHPLYPFLFHLRRVFTWALAVSLLTLLGVGAHLVDVKSEGVRARVGNETTPEVAPSVQNTGPFSFVVVSTQGNTTSSIVSALDQSQPLSPHFAVLCGKGSLAGGPVEMDFLASQIGELELDFPIFLSPGTVMKEGALSGSFPFHFTYRGCLFILLDGSTYVEGSARRAALEKCLASEGMNASQIFLFAPMSPFVSEKIGVGDRTVVSGFLKFLTDMTVQYDIDYFIAGEGDGVRKDSYLDATLIEIDDRHLVEVIVDEDISVARFFDVSQKVRPWDRCEYVLMQLGYAIFYNQYGGIVLAVLLLLFFLRYALSYGVTRRFMKA